MSNIFENASTFKKAFIEQVEKTYALDFKESSSYQQYVALGTLLKEHISLDWKETKKIEADQRQVYYFSMEFLMGRMITNNLMNAGVYDVVKSAFDDLGLDINEIEHKETDAGLGNGGLGRLAACFMDSVAALALPVHGNCIRYRYGFFKQKIENGYQVEYPDRWLKDIHVWEVRRDEEAVDIPFYGYIELSVTDGKLNVFHRNAEYVKAVPYDVPIVGYNNQVVNTLRLWSAEPSDRYQNQGGTFDYHKKLRQISEMLYPNDDTDEGKILRLKQQYLFSSAGVNAVIKKHKKLFGTLENLAEKAVFHINDTHPTLIIPELMRILVDEESMEWDHAWDITKRCVAYTNHTILAEALEKWPIRLFQPLLPRIYTITEEINRRFEIELKQRFGDNAREVENMQILKNGMVHMANLAIVGSFSVNGVAQLHTDILKDIEMRDFAQYYPNKFNNKTNGITHRRWVLQSNPEIVSILKDTIGDGWITDTSKLEGLVQFADDASVQKRFEAMKLARKQALADKIYKEQGVKLNPHAIFDIQVKRLHEYKRQLMNALHIMYLYNELKSNPEMRKQFYPQNFIFGAKAAPTYWFAKKVIKLINTIAEKVNNDPETNDLLKVVFVEDYNVTYAETIMPAADLSEQISTASKEASGTGNMKFMMNGAITIGTLDGANVEIADFVGQENIIIFGLNAKEVTDIYKKGNYQPYEMYQRDPRIKKVLDQLTNGFFTNVQPNEFEEIRRNLLDRDVYLVLKDFDAYVAAQAKANKLYQNRAAWLKMSIMNTAKSGFFSTDRTMEEYNKDIWHVNKIK
ncbi:glycogen/starch/alpha-glucan phosphorylase [Paracholeplasma manati]|uniref:glycogen/starch/alpha-glucan phosphorylase n=1 Tax=Paracholeplasma manati TaxID=591373 RepID=UPI0024085E1B|nr:glycogen/starch/alpha-glucan phosphorylase [Paracholeplasma manati]MDG0887984.1 glycogen/starch/alpha-glucan phosphorylase [Paracholeplasma manati]